MTGRTADRWALTIVMVVTGAVAGAMLGGLEIAILMGLGGLCFAEVAAHDYLKKE